MAEQARLFGGKKFMWDGREYDSDKEAGSAQKGYTDNGFEVQVYRENGKTYLYTRRIVTEIVVE